MPLLWYIYSLRLEEPSLYPEQPPMVGHSFLHKLEGGSTDMRPKWKVVQTKKSRPPEATQSLYQEQPSFKLSELKPRIWTSVSHFIKGRGTHS